MSASPERDLRLLHELEPTARALLDRHLSIAKEWFPHEYVPWSAGRDFTDDPWRPEQARFDDIVQVAFEVNVLTEDNLPSYHRLIYSAFGQGDGAWINWVHRWTAEEARHAIVLRDFLTVTRNIDPIALERARMQHMSAGWTRDSDLLRGLAYVTLQECATRVSHHNTGRLCGDPLAGRITTRVAQDENLHMVFYRDAMAAAIALRPSEAVEAIATEVESFTMPGTGITDFVRKAARMAAAGVYDLRIHHDEVVWPLLRYWRVFELGALDERGERARQRLAAFMNELDRDARRFEEKRAAKAARILSRT